MLAFEASGGGVDAARLHLRAVRWLGLMVVSGLIIASGGPALQAQEVKTIELGTRSGAAFSFHGATNGRLRTFASDDEARRVVKWVLSSMGLPLRFEVRAAAVGNASAVLQKDGSRLILYNTLFMDEIKAHTGRYWALISIMAHEIGHHLAFHLAKHVENHEAELEADYFSGYILARMGATLDDALAAMRALATDQATPSHPGKKERLQAIAAGWKNGRAGGVARPDVGLAGVERGTPDSATSDGSGGAGAAGSIRGIRHARSPRSRAGACADNLGTYYCVSSYLPTSGINRSDYGPASLFDQSGTTAWVEGRTGREDDGIGEWVLLDWQYERQLKGFLIRNGYPKTARLFDANGRVARMRVRFSNGRTAEIDLSTATDSVQRVMFREPQTTMWVQFEILGARRGTKYSDTAISEISPVFE